MNNLINKGLKVASYTVGGLNILKGEASKGLMLINSQRQISNLEEIDKDIREGNKALYEGFDSLNNHFENLTEINETGFSELSKNTKAVRESIVKLGADMKAVEFAVKEMGAEIVEMLYKQIIQQREFQAQFIESNEQIKEVLDRILIENTKQTFALENPDQIASNEKLQTARKMIKLFDSKSNNIESIQDAIEISKDAFEIDPFNEAAIFYCAKWMNIIGIAGWKEMYVDSMKKTIIELENNNESQLELAKENAYRLSISASIDIIESLDFKLFGEEFYSFAKDHCGEHFLITLEVFYFYYLCYKANEKKAYKHLLGCYSRFGEKNIDKELTANPMTLGFDTFWSCKNRLNLERKKNKEKKAQEKAQEELRRKLEAERVKEYKEMIYQNINNRIWEYEKFIKKLTLNEVHENLILQELRPILKQEDVENSKIIKKLNKKDHELNIFKWKPSKKKISSLELGALSSDAIFGLCLDEVSIASEKLYNVAHEFYSLNHDLISDHEKLSEALVNHKHETKFPDTFNLTSGVQGIKTERKFLQNTLNILKKNNDSLKRSKVKFDYHIDDYYDQTKKLYEEMIKSIVKEAFAYICVVNDILNEKKYNQSGIDQSKDLKVNKKNSGMLNSFFEKIQTSLSDNEYKKKVGLSSDDIQRIWNQELQIDDADVLNHKELQNFFYELFMIIDNFPNIHNMNSDIFNLNMELHELLNNCNQDFLYMAVKDYKSMIDKDLNTVKEIKKAVKLFQ